MKKIVLAVFATFATLSLKAGAQEVLPIGYIPKVEDNRPMQFAISGFEIITFTQADKGMNPFMRSAVCDARLSAIIQRTQEPPLRPSDIRVEQKNGRYLVVLRRYLLTEVRPQDARAAGVSPASLAQKWCSATRRAVPAILPIPSRFGI